MSDDRTTIDPIEPEGLHDGIGVVGLSDVGCEREENQDFMGWFPADGAQLLVVCDGMGGHRGGFEASRIAVRTIGAVFEADPQRDAAEMLRDAIERADQAVLQAAHDDPSLADMGSTAVVALIRDGAVVVGHVGDSRAYRVRKGEITRLTRDHTEVNRLVELGLIPEEEADRHPMGHWLAQSVGVNPGVKVDVSEPLPMQQGDRILLCSDGLSGVLTDAEIGRLMGPQVELRAGLDLAVELTLARGAPDNVTVLVGQIPAPLEEGPLPVLDEFRPEQTEETRPNLPVVPALLRRLMVWGAVGVVGALVFLTFKLIGD